MVSILNGGMLTEIIQRLIDGKNVHQAGLKRFFGMSTI